MEKTGVIYILTNPSFPEYVKIGYAQNPVGHGFKTVEDQLQIHLGTGAVDAGVVLVGQEAAFETGYEFSAAEDLHPRGGSVGIQAVRE